MRLALFIYVAIIFVVYFVFSGNTILRYVFREEGWSFVWANMINLMPFRNITDWIVNYERFNPGIVFRNLILADTG